MKNSTTGRWNPFLLQMAWLGKLLWNERRRNTSWLEPHAQMAARREWHCMDRQTDSPFHSDLLLCRFRLFHGKHFLKENHLYYSKKNHWLYNSVFQYILVRVSFPAVKKSQVLIECKIAQVWAALRVIYFFEVPPQQLSLLGWAPYSTSET